MSRHKIHWYRSGSTNGTDWEDEQTITFEFRAGRPAVMYLRNGDPGYPADPDELEVVSITPGSVLLHDEAQEWLHTDGFDEAVSIALADQEYEREYAAELRSGR